MCVRERENEKGERRREKGERKERERERNLFVNECVDVARAECVDVSGVDVSSVDVASGVV